MSALLAHFKRMQEMAEAYLLPDTYRDREGRHSDDHNGEKQSVRDNLFANDMIYMLDGPEQRTAEAAVAEPRCGKCGAQVDERYDCCEVHAETSPKVGDGSGDAALAIGEHAFRAAWEAATHQLANGIYDVDSAWSDYDPPEEIKALS